jgi:O-antigen/teichoic acid export membrane protein
MLREGAPGQRWDPIDPSGGTGSLPPEGGAPGMSGAAGRSIAHGLSPNEERRIRQQEGLELLLRLSVQVPFAMSEAQTALGPAVNVSSADPAAVSPGSVDQGARQRGPAPEKEHAREHRMFRAGLRADHLVRNSLYLMLSSGLQAALGFAFWIIMARLFTTQDVGRASALISATSLIALFALFGLNSSLVRYLPTAANRNSLITGAFMLVIGCACVISLAYILLTPVFAPRLSFVSHRPLLAAGFVLLTAAAAVNLLTDSVFIASRKAGLCALTDGGVGGLSKIALGVVLAGGGSYGVFCAAGGGLAAAAVVSIVLIITILRWRPSFTELFRTLTPLVKFSGANYIANVLILLPSVVVPIIVLDRLGARPAAFYFVAFQMATLLYTSVQAVEQAFLAEGSQAGADWRKIRGRSRRLAMALFVPGCAVLVLTGRWVLLLFGPRYSVAGSRPLELMALAVIPIALCNWSWTVLRLAGRLPALIVSTAIFALGICGTAWILASRGLTALAAGWPIGCTIAGIIALVIASPVLHKPARHRRPSRRRAATGRRRTPASSPGQ